MAGRQAHGRQSHGRPLISGSKKGPKTDKTQRRSTVRTQATALDAYNIAIKNFPQKEKRTPRACYMNVEDEEKEVEQNDEDEDEEEQGNQKRRRKRDDGSDAEYGSDESGNEWKVNGCINSDEDSELDSDEAFGESDEEKFADFTFGGTASKSKPKRKANSDEDNKDDEEDNNAYDYDDLSSLGSDAVDLATALDMAEEESEEEKQANEADSESGSGDDSEDYSDNTSEDGSKSDDDVDGSSRAKVSLKDLASEFAGFNDEEEEENAGSGKKKISLSDLGLIKARDASVRKSVKFLSKEETDGRASAKLAVPLAPLQQAQVTRKVAFEKTADTLDRWTETIKHNRRADHLQFPLLQETPNYSLSTKEFRPLTAATATTDLEKTMIDLLAQSGMSLEREKKKKLDADGNELTPEQLKELINKRRWERETRSREQQRAKRIKKIKSKAYHRVHRKQAQKDEIAIRAEMEANGEIDSEAEREDAARKRAAERVGARHKDSKWAKANSRTKRAVWDEEYREDLEDMARRADELKRRIDGENDSGSDVGSDSEEYSNDDEIDKKTRLRRQLGKLKSERDEGPKSLLNKMDFMQRIENQRKTENDRAIKEIEQMLASGSEDEDSESEGMINGQVSRQSYVGRRNAETKEINIDSAPDSDSDSERSKKIVKTTASSAAPTKTPKNVAASALVRKGDQRRAVGRSATEANEEEIEFVLNNKDVDLNNGDAWATAPRNKKPSKNSKVDVTKNVDLDLDAAMATVLAKDPEPTFKVAPQTPKPIPKDCSLSVKKQQAAELTADSSDSDSYHPLYHPLALKSNHDLIARAFAGGDLVAADFAAEKEAIIADQDDKIVDNTLPGWGAWVGEGVSKHEANKHKGRFTTTIAGVKRKNRQDTKLERVIVNEKRVKKNDRYLASQLPHQFESTEQYERSLKMNVGKEWMTKETFQASTKPRVLIKQGIIKPMSRPMR